MELNHQCVIKLKIHTDVPVTDLPDAVTAAHANYGLYAYGEGKSVKQLEEGEFSGIPVLFIPGNSGSYKQGRADGFVVPMFAMNAKV